MLLKTILNHVEPHKSFVYKECRFDQRAKRPTFTIQIEHRANGRPICSGCGQVRPGYDRLPSRTWEFVPLWQIPVLFVYALRRVNCPECGVTAEKVPWGEGKCRQTTSYRWFLARWAGRLSWKKTAEVFHTSWDSVFRAVRRAVLWGVLHRPVQDVVAIGVDEIAWKKGHQYLTLVYQIDARVRRLLWVTKDRTEDSLREFFDVLGDDVQATLRYVSSDMWKPYLSVLGERAGGACHVLDRYHIMAHLNKAIDQIRAEESRRLKADGYEAVLKHSRWCLLKRPSRLTRKQTVKLRELQKYNLRTMRAWLLKEDFQRFWTYHQPGWARRFLREWCHRAMRSRLEPMKRVARMLRSHEELLLNWFRANGEISQGIVEGLNNKAKVTIRKSYGFRTYEGIETALYHGLGDLPEPKLAHEFC